MPALATRVTSANAEVKYMNAMMGRLNWKEAETCSRSTKAKSFIQNVVDREQTERVTSRDGRSFEQAPQDSGKPATSLDSPRPDML